MTESNKSIQCTYCHYRNPVGALVCKQCRQSLTSGLITETQRIDDYLKSEIQLDSPQVEPLHLDTSASIYFQQIDGNQFIRMDYLPGQYTIGRHDPKREISPDIDLAVFNAGNHGVSRLHANLRCTKQKVYLQDLNSVNGTYYKGKRLAPSVYVEVKTDQVVQFGTLQLYIVFQTNNEILHDDSH